MSEPTRIVILGAGFGGLELSTALCTALAGTVDVTLIDQHDAFVFGFSKLDVMFGRQTMDEVSLRYSGIARPGLTFRQETVQSIDPVNKRVVTDSGTYDVDILVVALGADLAPETTPGLLEHGHEFYSVAAAPAVREVIENFAGGRVVIGVLGGFFKCPPAPYEMAFLLRDHLERVGLWEQSSISIVTPMPKPIPISDDVSNGIIGALDAVGISYSHGTWTDRLEPGIAHLRDGREVPFDLFLGVPVHVAPGVVVDAGLTDDGWIAVDQNTFATKFADVYAIGDVASVPVPRAGVIAEGEARTLAEVLIHRLGGGPEPAPFPGEIMCYIEMGADRIGRVNVNFLSGPAPVARYTPPSLEGSAEKGEFGATRRARWFGLA